MLTIFLCRMKIDWFTILIMWFQCKYYALSGLKSIQIDYRLYHLPMSPFHSAIVQNKSRFPAPKAYYATSHTGKLYNHYDEPKAEVFLLSMCKSYKKYLPYEAVIQAESCTVNLSVCWMTKWYFLRGGGVCQSKHSGAWCSQRPELHVQLFGGCSQWQHGALTHCQHFLSTDECWTTIKP